MGDRKYSHVPVLVDMWITDNIEARHTLSVSAATNDHKVACMCGEAYPCSARKLGDAMRAGLDLHDLNVHGNCRICETPYPCLTIKMVTAVLQDE